MIAGLFSSLLEMTSLAAMMPFIAVLLNPTGLYQLPVAGAWLESFNLTNQELIAWTTCAFCLVILLSGVFRTWVLYACNRFCFGLGRDMTDDIYAKTLHQSYATHVERNSAEVLNVLNTSANEVIFYVVLPCLTITISALSVFAIGLSLAVILPSYALLAFLSLAGVYLLIVRFLKEKLNRNSNFINSAQIRYQKQIQESLGAIREIIIDHNQRMFVEMFRANNRAMRAAQSQNQFMSQSPRYFLETLGIVIVAVIAYLMTIRNANAADVTLTLSTLAVMALGLQRLLPLAQTCYQSWAMLNGAAAALERTLQLLDQRYREAQQPACHEFRFTKSIDLMHVQFKYPGKADNVLDSISLHLPAGASIGIVGASGSGKSTLMDLLLGLREPTAGEIRIDGVALADLGARSWLRCVAHVPQAAYLLDASVRTNIAFTYDEALIDDQKIRTICQTLAMDSFIEDLSEGYHTVIGERGIQLSGGQRQRLAIARALYKSAPVLILDEATSALDESSEEHILCAIQAMNPRPTLICVTHRLKTLQHFDQVYQITDGGVSELAA